MQRNQIGVMDKHMETSGSSQPSDSTILTALTTATSSSTAPTNRTSDSPPVPQLPDSAVFDKVKVTVVFVLGGPGAGESPCAVPTYG